MAPQIALLRAINVGGHQAVSMERIRGSFERAGARRVRSLLASGNFVFEIPGRAGPALERWLEDALRNELGLDTDVLVRSDAEWEALITANPFPREAESDPAHLLLVALKAVPPPATLRRLQVAVVGREKVKLVGRELFIVYPDGIGRSKLTNVVIERALGIRGTGRNWNTVQKLRALATGAG